MRDGERGVSRGLVGLLMLAAAPAVAADPMSWEAPQPKTASEAEALVRQTVHDWTGEYPDSVSCTLIFEEGAHSFECWATKAGYEKVLMFLTPG